MKAVWAACLGVMFCPGAVRADLSTPGFKSRELCVVFDNLTDYPDHIFYLVPAGWLAPGQQKSGTGWPDSPKQARVMPGEAYRPGYPARWARNWVMIAVPRSRGEPTDQAGWTALATGAPGVLYSNWVPLEEPDSVPVSDPRDYEVHHFRVALAHGELTLTPGPIEQGSNGIGSWVPALLIAGMVTGLGVWIVRRVRRSRRTPQQPAAEAK